jgi:hypothetical protein
MRELQPLAPPKEPFDAELAQGDGEPAKSEEQKVPKARRGRWWLAGAAVVLAGAGVVASWPRASVSIIRDLAPPVVATLEPPPPSPAKPAEPAPLVVKTKTHPRPPAPRPPAPPAPPTGSGHLLVGGEGALRAEIWIDGSSRGFAPKLLELPSGPHEVELLLGNGSRIKKRITLAESNTPSAPLRWLVP